MTESATSQSIKNELIAPYEVRLPYFDLLFRLFQEGDREIEASFGRHVHWGLWDDPQRATLTVDDFAIATENLCRRICLAAAMEHGLAVLDVGCGFGGTVAHINENYADMHLVGLNLDERQLQRARSQVQPVSRNHIEFRQGNACALPFPDQSFDIVLAVECIFHFPSRASFFQEVQRVLKPDGRLALSDFVVNGAIVPLVKFRSAVTDRFSSGFYGRCELNYTEKDYCQLAEKNLFQPLIQENVTVKTLPTYTYIKTLARSSRINGIAAMFETAAAEWASRLGLLNYYIFAWRKN